MQPASCPFCLVTQSAPVTRWGGGCSCPTHPTPAYLRDPTPRPSTPEHMCHLTKLALFFFWHPCSTREGGRVMCWCHGHKVMQLLGAWMAWLQGPWDKLVQGMWGSSMTSASLCGHSIRTLLGLLLQCHIGAGRNGLAAMWAPDIIKAYQLFSWKLYNIKYGFEGDFCFMFIHYQCLFFSQ